MSLYTIEEPSSNEAGDRLLLGLREFSLTLDQIEEYAGRADLSIRDKKGNSVLHLAVTDDIREEQKVTAVVSLLIRMGANVDALNDMGETPLVWAVYLGRSLISKLLIENDADKDIKVGGSGNTLEHYAASSRKPRILEFVNLTCNANWEVTDNTGKTPLMFAAEKDGVRQIKYLTARGADVKKTDHLGETALFKAVRLKNNRAVWALLEEDPYTQLKIKNNENTDVIQLAQESKFKIERDLKTLQQREKSCFRSTFDRVTNNIYRLETRRWTAFKFKIFFLAQQILATLQIWLWFVKINSLLSIFLTVMQFFGIVLYINLYLSSPGYITKGWASGNKDPSREKLLSEKRDEYEDAVRNATNKNVCVTCKCIAPVRSKHCKELNLCVYEYDHYCPFIGTAIGKENHGAFVFFLVWTVLTLSLYFYLTWLVCVEFYTKGFKFVRGHKLVVALSAVTEVCTIPISIFVLQLLGNHVYLIGVNLTTNEYINHERYSYLKKDEVFNNPYDHGFCINCHRFWCKVSADGLDEHQNP